MGASWPRGSFTNITVRVNCPGNCQQPHQCALRENRQKLETTAHFNCISHLNEQEPSPEVTTKTQARSTKITILGNCIGRGENSFVDPMSLAGFRRVNDEGDYLSPRISLSSNLSSTISCSSNSKVNLKCHVCLKPRATTFSPPLNRCLQCKRLFHPECHNPPVPIVTQQQ